MAYGGGYTFARVPVADIPRSAFNRSHGHKTTFDAGWLIPVYVDEALPGDTFHVSASMFARLSTPLVPIMDNMFLDAFFFAVPNRLIWNNWQKFMGEQTDPDDSTDFLVPVIDAPAAGFDIESVYDYMGMPTGVPNLRVSALWARAYNLIYNEWFRDENLQNSVPVPKDDGPDPVANYNLLRRGKRHDYFTSALPWPQKGIGVELPIGATAPVVPRVAGAAPFFHSTGGDNGNLAAINSADPYAVKFATGGAGGVGDLQWYDSGLVADLAQATSATINSVRQAFQIQKLLERDARGGTRYTEILRSHFGVVSPDARLQRPEYLGGGSVPVTINPVAQTSGTAPASGGYTNTPQGNLAGFGIAAGSGIGFSKSFVEHCVIIGLVMVRGDLNYQQGLPRMFSRRTRYDFYWPAFSHLGEQTVLNKEIYAQGPAVVDGNGESIDDKAFGYQERWAEYRYFPGKITGKFRSSDPQTLDIWHLAQKFDSLPVLGNTFIMENPPVERIVAVPTEPHFIFDSHFRMKCVRPMPVYSVPGYLDHF